MITEIGNFLLSIATALSFCMFFIIFTGKIINVGSRLLFCAKAELNSKICEVKISKKNTANLFNIFITSLVYVYNVVCRLVKFKILSAF